MQQVEHRAKAAVAHHPLTVLPSPSSPLGYALLRLLQSHPGRLLRVHPVIAFALAYVGATVLWAMLSSPVWVLPVCLVVVTVFLVLHLHDVHHG